MTTVGPTLEASQQLRQEKYHGEGEGFRECVNRFSSAMKDGDEHFKSFRDACMEQRFLPAGRIQSAMGSTKRITPYNCYVSGYIEDSFVDGQGSIMERAKQAAATMRRGGGIGYDFSSLRPRGALIKKLSSRSSGPLSFMNIFDSVCATVQSAGHRRGAQMGVLRVDHPDIEEFVHAKQNSTTLTNFNISIAITDRFMECLASGEEFPLTWGGEIYRMIDPQALWEQIMRSTWDWAEPGVLFIDRINEMNNLYYCETISATNPCAEQPLPPFGACLLGSFNLTKYMRPINPGAKGPGSFNFNTELLRADIPHVIRAMDNVVDRALYPLYEQEKEAQNKRRMGVGVTGLANALEAWGYPYGSKSFLEAEGAILQLINTECYRASVDLAKEKGSFPLFNSDKYCDSKFIEQALPDDLREEVARHGIRNSHLTSIAPTGTISFCADNVSSGIEPVFSYAYDRTVKTFDSEKIERVEDYAVREFGVKGVQTANVTAQEHVNVLTVASQWVDSAVSKTCNVSGDMPWEDFKNIYVQAWQNNCKGCTTFNAAGKRYGILNAVEEPVEEGTACYIDEGTGLKTCE